MMRTMFPILLFIFIISLPQSKSNGISAHVSEQQTLLNIKSMFFHPHSDLASWRNNSLDICQWRGVTCSNNYPRHVTALDLADLQLGGSLSPVIADLTFIKRINLRNNSLHGEVVANLHRIKSLEHLDLSYNQLNGLVPNSLYNISSLTYLNLHKNNLTGAIPRNIGQRFPKLEMLDLAFNNFHGSLSKLITSLANCSALQTLDFTDNNLSGNLPNTIGNFSTKLNKLLIGYNNIYGLIPQEIGNLVNLTDLDLTCNFIEGVLPSTVGSLSKLGRMQISNNTLSGRIPDSISNLTELNTLLLEYNKLNGTILADLGNCSKLQYLLICSNHLEGIIPTDLFRLDSQIIKFDASHNHLEGPIPVVPMVGSLSALQLAGNNLNGPIPPSLSSLPSLEMLYLGDNNIQGSIPESFASMKVIRALDLSQNNLSGTIPDFLSSLRSLRYLNLSFNNFVGEVPAGGIFNHSSAVSLLGNQGLCSSDPQLHLPSCAAPVPDASTGSSKLVAIISVTVTIAVLICLCFLVSILYRLRRKGKNTKMQTPAPFRDDKYKKVSYADITKATDGFSSTNLVGAGSFGSVYKGILDNELIAVKVFDLEQHGALRSFNTECASLRNIRHKNLVCVITSCSSIDFRGNEFKSLIFKYISNGSLEEWIHPKTSRKKLSLADGINIAMDVASAVCYLHHDCATPMVHCDIKPSNILIDTDMTALVSDFGLARFLASSNSCASAKASTTLLGLKGTIGYIAPEYASGITVSTKGDVYSFGIVLLEMLTGKRPTDAMFKDGFNIHAYISGAFPENIGEVLDPRMFEELKSCESDLENGNCHSNMVMETCIIPLLQIGLACSKEAPKDRMRMDDAAAEISKIKQKYLPRNC